MAEARFKSAAAVRSRSKKGVPQKPLHAALFPQNKDSPLPEDIDHGSINLPCAPACSNDDQKKDISEITMRMKQCVHISQPHNKLNNIRSDVDLKSPRFKCVLYYGSQTCNVLREGPPIDFPVWISSGEDNDTRPVDATWYQHIKASIGDINEAAPGLNLHIIVVGEENAKIKVVGHRDPTVARSCPSYLIKQTESRHVYHAATIELGAGWAENEKKGTCLHEFLHALGFDHEHQRKDAGESMINKAKEDDYNYAIQDEVVGLTRFDPFSIMLYPQDESLKGVSHLDTVWNLAENLEGEKNTMSELDKVGLNLLYPPCKTPSYDPKKSTDNGMWYCGRRVLGPHNAPAEDMTDGTCGPTNWANCPACRTLENTKVDEFLSQGRWQGWSGLVYCGRSFEKRSSGHDGYCGPNNGFPCLACGRILYQDYHH